MRYIENIEQLHSPDIVLRDYETVHGFLYEISTCLEPQYRNFFDQVIADPYPGYELKIKRVTKILPEVVITLMLQGMRYDDELKVQW